MKRYIGTKIVHAEPGVAPRDMGEHKAGEPGMIVEYEDGYRSWSPMDAFEGAYRPCEAMTFGLAIEAAKKGHKIARAGWNGKGMWVVLMSGMSLPPFSSQSPGKKVNDRTARLIGEDTPLETLPYFAMWTVNAQGRRAWLPGWLASQTDMLADDWTIVDA